MVTRPSRDKDFTEKLGRRFAAQHGLTVGDEILMAIGATVVFQSRIEAQLALFVERLANIEDEKGVAITAEMSFRALCAALSSLVLVELPRESDRYQNFERLMGQLKQFEEFRNQVAHSVWEHRKDSNSAHSATRTKLTAKQGKGVKLHLEYVDLARMSREIEVANQTMLELVTFTDSLFPVRNFS